ncbi:aldo/keto reductase [Rhodococcus sp. NPDC019627]|uniref:aldo/keto reductase n=1 Tax=unclassified Rhodococcus (in: high G+C Gram-positive bacteria) TaxID=192944 RepID=UPI00340BDBCF
MEPTGQGPGRPPLGVQTERSQNDPVGKSAFDGDGNKDIADAVQQVAENRGISMAQVGLAWVMRHPVVSAPIVGATKEYHLADAIAAVDVRLTDDEIAALEAPYTVRKPTGYS